MRFLTLETCQRPPRGIRTPQSLRAEANPRKIDRCNGVACWQRPLRHPVADEVDDLKFDFLALRVLEKLDLPLALSTASGTFRDAVKIARARRRPSAFTGGFPRSICQRDSGSRNGELMIGESATACAKSPTRFRVLVTARSEIVGHGVELSPRLRRLYGTTSGGTTSGASPLG
jgi:hypothetical protein